MATVAFSENTLSSIRFLCIKEFSAIIKGANSLFFLKKKEK
jgi:hypothetical protein